MLYFHEYSITQMRHSERKFSIDFKNIEYSYYFLAIRVVIYIHLHSLTEPRQLGIDEIQQKVHEHFLTN